MAYTSRYIKTTLDEALEIIKANGYDFECFTALKPIYTWEGIRVEESLIGISRGNGVWHWYIVEETKAKLFDLPSLGNQLEYSHSYSQNTGKTFKKNQDYIKTAVNLLTK